MISLVWIDLFWCEYPFWKGWNAVYKDILSNRMCTNRIPSWLGDSLCHHHCAPGGKQWTCQQFVLDIIFTTSKLFYHKKGHSNVYHVEWSKTDDPFKRYPISKPIQFPSQYISMGKREMHSHFGFICCQNDFFVTS